MQNESAVRFQAMHRAFLDRLCFVRFRAAVVNPNRMAQDVHTRKAFEHIRMSSILIQAVYRGWGLRRQQKVAMCLLSNRAARSIQTV